MKFYILNLVKRPASRAVLCGFANTEAEAWEVARLCADDPRVLVSIIYRRRHLPWFWRWWLP